METLSPTLELKQHVETLRPPAKTRHEDRAAWQIVRIVDELMDAGLIDERARNAARDLSMDYHLGMSMPGLTASYGERMRGDTPLSQRAIDTITPEERKSFAYQKAHAALASIDNHEALQMIQHCIINENKLIKASCAVFGGSRNHATGMGKFALVCGLRSLADFYYPNCDTGQPRY